MGAGKLTLLNTSILTEYGTYVYAPLDTGAARALVREYLDDGLPVESAVGHEATAELLSLLLDHPVVVNRVVFRQAAGEVALVFKLRDRPPEGVVLGRGELEAIGYDFGLLTRSE
jgi:hypothetical protein